MLGIRGDAPTDTIVYVAPAANGGSEGQVSAVIASGEKGMGIASLTRRTVFTTD